MQSNTGAGSNATASAPTSAATATATATAAPSTPKTILYCLDFDGVLCDSVHETFLSGWRACKLIWKKKNSYTWIDVVEKDPLRWKQLEEDFRYVRPILYVGWEAILLIRLLAVGYRDEIAGTPLDDNQDGKSVFSARDAVFRRFHNARVDTDADAGSKSFRDHALEAWGVSKEGYEDAMADARMGWIEADWRSWIDAHGFYQGACEAVRNCLAQKGNSDIYVITTKAKELALMLLEKQGLFEDKDETDDKDDEDNGNGNVSHTNPSMIQESHVFGLGSGPKASVLQQILEERQNQNPNEATATIKNECEHQYVAVMVEDNIATLDKISKSPVGNKVLPVVASWGYNSIEQLTDVLLATTSSRNNDNGNRQSYVVLPLRKESSPFRACDTPQTAREFAERGKQRDPTGCSLASILQTPFDAGTLLADKTGAEAGEEEESYDFSSKRDIAQDCFRQRS